MKQQRQEEEEQAQRQQQDRGAGSGGRANGSGGGGGSTLPRVTVDFDLAGRQAAVARLAEEARRLRNLDSRLFRTQRHPSAAQARRPPASKAQ